MVKETITGRLVKNSVSKLFESKFYGEDPI